MNGETMWTHETLIDDKSTDAAFVFESSSNTILNPVSRLQEFVQSTDGFQSGTKSFKLFIDKTNRDSLLATFKLNFVASEDG